ncbi:hypothetical protein [Mucilaginibacter paludis]|uniref:hypothetical protein n=1 Tax=Mucilaginibacter paludis TaxID=423351 RepID=UPI0002555B50|nr:hypothetical protein [Mucilaginibacter paludis]
MNKIKLSLVFTLLCALMMAFTNANHPADSNQIAANFTLPVIKKTNGVKQLYVNNKPYLIIGAELLNSSASSITYMSDIWKRAKALNVNTIYLPVTWQHVTS